MKENKCKRIVISDGGSAEEVDVIEGPFELMDSLGQYIGKFNEYREKNYYGLWEDYDVTQGFVEYLNKEVLKVGWNQVRIIGRQVKEYNRKWKRYNI